MKIINYCERSSLKNISFKGALISASITVIGLTLLVIGIIVFMQQLLPLGVVLLGTGGACLILGLISTIITCVRQKKLESVERVTDQHEGSANLTLVDLQSSYDLYYTLYHTLGEEVDQLVQKIRLLIEKDEQLKEKFEKNDEAINQFIINSKQSRVQEETYLDQLKDDRSFAWWAGEEALKTVTNWTVGWFYDTEEGSVDPEAKKLQQIQELVLYEQTQQGKFDNLVEEKKQEQLDIQVVLAGNHKDMEELNHRIERRKEHKDKISDYLLQINQFIAGMTQVERNELPDTPGAFLDVEAPIMEELELPEIEGVEEYLNLFDPAIQPKNFNIDLTTASILTFVKDFHSWMQVDALDFCDFCQKIFNNELDVSAITKKINFILREIFPSLQLLVKSKCTRPLKNLIQLTDFISTKEFLALLAKHVEVKKDFKMFILTLFNAMSVDEAMFSIFMTMINAIFTMAHTKGITSQQELMSFCEYLGISIERYNHAVQTADFVNLMVDLCEIKEEEAPGLREKLEQGSVLNFAAFYKEYLSKNIKYDSPSSVEDLNKLCTILKNKLGIGKFIADALYFRVHQTSKLFQSRQEHIFSFLKNLSKNMSHQITILNVVKQWVNIPIPSILNILEGVLSLLFHFKSFDAGIQSRFFKDLEIPQVNLERSIQQGYFFRLIAPQFYRKQ
ncbi:hypothetical protein CLAVI_000431 [Candidatus Clavichlamydia salmonicola]|uniref:hypothetical protein n=1 Tax=Candidatus Clavichlamydia salmonicola TaxID=469812 RepID=UPI0018913DC0|nr:hypothetical protein [Candidatus Clavichlamydia salmonicola]MBF5050812.1 hypothetical protein [Candidatus Clavichlamydia salmonicola]